MEDKSDLSGLEHYPVIRFDGVRFGKAEAPLIREYP